MAYSYMGVGSTESTGKGTDTKSWTQPTTNTNIQLPTHNNNSNRTPATPIQSTAVTYVNPVANIRTAQEAEEDALINFLQAKYDPYFVSSTAPQAGVGAFYGQSTTSPTGYQGAPAYVDNPMSYMGQSTSSSTGYQGAAAYKDTPASTPTAYMGQSNSSTTGYQGAPAYVDTSVSTPMSYMGQSTSTDQTNNGVVASPVDGSNAFYPSGKEDKAQPDLIPTTPLGMLGLVTNPAATAIKGAIPSFVNQVKYGMNEASALEYARLQELGGAAWESMTEAQRVDLARSKYKDANNLNYVAPIKPDTMSDQIWNNLTDGQKLTFASNKKEIEQSAGGSSGGSSSGNGTTSDATSTGGDPTIPSGVANNGQYFDGGYTGSAVDQLSQARAPRGMSFEDIYGTTRFNPLTGQMEQTLAPEFGQFQQGLLGQLQGAQQAYQSFDPNDAAAEYLRGVNAIREPMREQQTDSKLSQLIKSGKLGSTVGTQALAQLEAEQENQRFAEATQAMEYGTAMQDRMLANQAGMFGLTSQVADQQFKPYQQSLASVPMLQEIYGFAQEPQFQAQLAEQGINAQREANSSNNMWGLLGTVAKTDFGQDAIQTGFEWLTGNF